MSLVDFVLARLAEDEAAAHAAAHVAAAGPDPSYPSLQDGALRLAARMSAARVRAEVEAKLRLVDWSAPICDFERIPTDRPGVYDKRPVRYVNEDGEDVLRYLAMPYADHPDYRGEWRP